jgi:DNA-binding NtrC family response regulator
MTETLPSDESAATSRAAPESLALGIACSPGEPGRLGEVCIVPSARAGTAFVLGRGAAIPSDMHARLEFVRSRAGAFEARPPLASPRLSRVQLVLVANGTESIAVQNQGRCPLFCNDVQVESAVVVPGDTLQLGRELLLVCVRRSVWQPAVAALSPQTPFGEHDPYGLVGESPAAWDLRRRIAFLAPRSEHVLVVGESGTGKELVARALHDLSPRARMPFLARNAATFPEALVDAELFGHSRNYPNAGMSERRGLIGEAAGGTIFLDELAELPPSLQTHLLRVLDGGEYQRLGDSAVRVSDFRLIGATNQPTKLREDLAARLKLSLRVPTLAERVEDIPLLVVHLLRGIARTSDDIAARLFDGGDLRGEPRIALSLMGFLLRHRYTTNVRELEALLWEALTEGPEGVLDRPRRSQADRGSAAAASRPRVRSSGPPSAEAVSAALAQHGGSQDQAWRALGLSSRHALRRLMDKYGLKKQKA